jgi:hypothetical protein
MISCENSMLSKDRCYVQHMIEGEPTQILFAFLIDVSIF